MKAMILMTAIILFSHSAHAAGWVLYFENQAGNKFYIDAESVHRNPEGTILVWEQINSPDNAKKKVTLEVLNEIDCSRRKYRIVQGMLYSEGIQPFEKQIGSILPQTTVQTLYLK